MKKIALSLLKTADEKLRSIGSKPQQQPLSPVLQQSRQQPPAPAAPPLPARQPLMAERRVQLRQGRRERARDGDGDSKRRSRSEGPTARRPAQSMDVSSGRKANGQGCGEPETGVGRVSPTGSDDGRTQARTAKPDSSSDSDSDRNIWTKNPLLVRRVKKNKADKRNSASEPAPHPAGYSQLGQRNTNRESWVYLAPEGTPLPAPDTPVRPEGGGSQPGSVKNKYHKLEERRNKRLDLAVTSDEESSAINSPESRISRLRQRALQGGLGSSPRADNSRLAASDHNGTASVTVRPVHAVLSDQGSRHIAVHPIAPYAASTVVTSTQQPLGHQTPASTRTPRGSGFSAPNAKSPIVPVQQTVRQSLVKPFLDRSHSDVSPVTARAQFRTIPEPQNSVRAVHNSSPEVHVRRFNPAVRVPSADSIYDSVQYGQEVEVGRYNVPRATIVTGSQRTFTQFSPTSKDVMELRHGTALQYRPTSQASPADNKANSDVVELRLKSSRVIDRPLSQTFADTGNTRWREAGLHTDDSLDELVESNIQYLESELSQSANKKHSTPVSRSTSVPNSNPSGKSQVTPVIPRVTVSGQQAKWPSLDAPVNKSEIHFRVPLPPVNASHPPPQIQIAEENQWSDSGYHGASLATRSERKLSYDSRTRAGRPASEYRERQDMSKSDTQLNAAVVTPTYHAALLQPSHTPSRVSTSDHNLALPEPAPGMFSDVEYDIEVSERVKKWETFMRKPDYGSGEGKKAPSVTLTPIDERTERERDSLMMPSELRRSMRLSDRAPPPATGSQLSGEPVSGFFYLKPASSDPALSLTGDARETSQFRIVQAVPEENQTNSTEYVDQPGRLTMLSQPPGLMSQPQGLMSAEELRQHMLANQRSRAQAASLSAAPQPHVSDTPDVGKRLSRYRDEIDEMKTVKHQSVSNLRRHFDEGRSVTSAEESRSGESRVAKVSPTQKEYGDVNWTMMISGLEDKIRDMEVWSPGMESTQGSVVSIERVKARTLQTIPFSEDPFWKEIEEMTTFDANSLDSTFKSSTTAHIEAASPHSSTLPTQTRQHNALPIRERMQRSKSLYTPNITPLTISVDSYVSGKTSSLERGGHADQYSGSSALDDVLEDIRLSMERKPLSPKPRAAGDSSDSHRSSPAPSYTSERLRSRTRPIPDKGPKWEGVTSSYGSSQVSQPPLALSISSQQQAPAAPQVVSGMNYHLDPNLLKQKLLSTGLVEDDKPEVPPRSRVPLVVSSTLSKPVAVAPPQTVLRSLVAPTQRAAPAPAPLPGQPDKLSQVKESMEDLRQLAVDVERKIGLIKSRLISADEQNLDKILLALRKFAPSAGNLSPELRSAGGGVKEFYFSKKNKLEEALGELERIYESLDLNNDLLLERAERRDYSSYRTRPADSATASGLLPRATSGISAVPIRASSIFIAPVSATSRTTEAPTVLTHTRIGTKSLDRSTESEFDMISKSFQAIIDEVNKTASLVSSANASSTSQPRVLRPLPEIKELQSRVYASRELDLHKQAQSPDLSRRPLTVTVSSQGLGGQPVPTPKSPPAVAPKPTFRVQTPAGVTQLTASSSVTGAVESGNVLAAGPRPVASIVRAEIISPALDKGETKARGRFRFKPSSQEREEMANRRARSKSSPTITLDDLQQSHAENKKSTEVNPTAKSQINFQIEPVTRTNTLESTGSKPPLRVDVTRAQQGSSVEFLIKPPAMYQDTAAPPSVTAIRELSQAGPRSPVVKASENSEPAPETKTVVYPGRPTVSSSVTHDASSSESCGEGRERRGGTQRMGRGVAMMVELFSSSDDERARRSHPLHTRSAPDLTAEPSADDAVNHVKDMRPAEISRVLQQREGGSGSPAMERRTVLGQTPSSPQSPGTKPPCHPLRRERASESSPLRQTSESGESGSPKPLARVLRRVKTVTVTRQSQEGAEDELSERPRSFHELLSAFEPDPQRLSKLRCLRKSASEDGLPDILEVALGRPNSFTSEPDLRQQQEAAPTLQEVQQWEMYRRTEVTGKKV